MKELVIEWRHFAVGGETCDRCSATGKSVREVVEELSGEFSGRGVSMRLIETVLPAELMAQSNMILFNGVPLEEILENAAVAESTCPSCSCLTGSATSCRTVEHGGISHEEIPAELIRRAALLAGVPITASPSTEKETMLRVKRVYDPREPDDGLRFLVDRLWPRGMKKEALGLDGWLKELAPSDALRHWFGHDPARWEEFHARYQSELEGNPAAWRPLLEAARGQVVTLLFAAHDSEHNNAVALAAFLEQKLADEEKGKSDVL